MHGSKATEPHGALDGTPRSLLAAAPDAMLMVDRHGRIVASNAMAEGLFGYGDDLVGRPVADLLPEDVRARHESLRRRFTSAPSNRAMGAGPPLTARHRDGSTLLVDISLAGLDTHDGTIVLAAIRDVTARQRAEEEARAERDRAERANRAKTEFLARVSHELRTPLNSILGFTQLLAADHPRPEQAEALELVADAGRHLLSLLDEVLELTQLEGGHVRLDPRPVAVADAVTGAVDLLRPLAAEAGVAVRVDAAGSPPAAVVADRQRLLQVLLNLITNAVKYNHRGGEVTVAWEHGGGAVRLAVRDTGIGIGDDDRDRVFQPFARVGADPTVPGAGLGLAVSRTLVEAMGGTIELRSTAHRGSTFAVTLPAAALDGDRPPGADPVAVDAAPPADSRPAPPRVVLYIEDNPANVRLVQEVLRRRPGAELITAADAAEGLHLARRHGPDLVLVDLQLPDRPGSEVVVELRGDPATAHIPLVVLSADASAGTIEDLRAAGASEYLTKPLDIARLLATVDLALAGPA